MNLSLYAIKPRFQAILDRLAARLVAARVPADALTALGLGAAALGGLLLATGGVRSGPLVLLVPPLLFVRIACNALDGMIARRAGTARPWGTVLNETGDRLADLCLFGGLVASGVLPAPVAGILPPLLLFVSYLGVVGQAAGGARRYEGPLGKADRALLLGFYCCCAPWFAGAGMVLGWALIAGLGLTVLNRAVALARDATLRRPNEPDTTPIASETAPQIQRRVAEGGR
ncbi:MAG TPA: CDP-alcohol phosphatidyltransferase family protein [Thermomicrobiales bacterium]